MNAREYIRACLWIFWVPRRLEWRALSSLLGSVLVDSRLAAPACHLVPQYVPLPVVCALGGMKVCYSCSLAELQLHGDCFRDPRKTEAGQTGVAEIISVTLPEALRKSSRMRPA